MSIMLGEANGFTPVIDVVANELGLVPAAVYGVVWRYCQGERRVCYASLDTMAEQLGVGRSTVQRHLQALCDAGYLEDTTPDLRNKPHTYRDTGRAQIVGMVQAHVSQRDTHVPEWDVTSQSGMSRPTVTHEESSNRVEEDTLPVAVAPVASDPPAKRKRAAKKEPSAVPDGETGYDPREWVPVLAEVCTLDAKMLFGRLAKRGKELFASGYTPEQIQVAYGKGGWWYKNDWRGQRGRSPTAEQIQATIVQALPIDEPRQQTPLVESSGGKPWWSEGGSLRLPVQTQHGRSGDD